MTFGNNAAYGFLDIKANMAHELGHALGFYHEHQRDDRDSHVVFNCQNLADWTQELQDQGFCTNLIAAKAHGWSSLNFIVYPQSFTEPPFNCYSNTYDEDSIMHYSGGIGAAKPRLPGISRKTVLGTKANPKTSFKKNLKPSSTDVARTNAMYTTQANQKRDVGKYCGPSARSTRTYTVAAALTSGLLATAAPIDITGTPTDAGAATITSAPVTDAGGQGTIGPLTSCSLVQ
ncbi:MAG: hypothetical protein Q9202_007315 [Teloschistes flavicans]